MENVTKKKIRGGTKQKAGKEERRKAGMSCSASQRTILLQRTGPYLGCVNKQSLRNIECRKGCSLQNIANERLPERDLKNRAVSRPGNHYPAIHFCLGIEK